MKFKEIVLKEGFYKKRIQFSRQANMIYSEKNATGKTTLLRAILYALGYTVPSTKGIKFDDMEFFLNLECNGIDFQIYRRESYLSIDDGKGIIGYSLPTDFYEVISKITGCNNVDIIDNLLGAFYLDQEKGWILLNRGKVIGNISFNIEALVRGLANKDCSEKIKKLEAVNWELKKHEYMYSVAKYQEEINEIGGNICYATPEEKDDRIIEVLRVEKTSIAEELRQIRDVLRKNNAFVKYISDMKLVVQGSTGEEIPVTPKTLIGFDDNNSFLAARSKILDGQLAYINNRIKLLETKKNKEEELMSVRTIIEEFDADIRKIQVDAIATLHVIDRLKSERSSLQEQIQEQTKINNPIITNLYSCINRYAKELDLSEKYLEPNENYIFTNKLKLLSGTILHKIAFCFRLAYLKEIRERTGIILPIILDSPSGREVRKGTVEKMLQIIQRDYSDHQLIVSSIYNFNLQNKKIIKLENQLFETDDISEQ